MVGPLDGAKLDEQTLAERRERTFIIFAGIFLGTLAMLNVLGVSRFIVLGDLELGALELTVAVAVGVLPYPITFLCTDFISEFWGRKRANFVVFTGLILNLWVMFILWLAGVLPPEVELDPHGLPALPEATDTGHAAVDEHGQVKDFDAWAFFRIRQLAFGAVTASMVAYMAAQFTDVFMFHFWKNLTKGRHLWLRNCGSTAVSQLVDSLAVISLTYLLGGLAGIITAEQPVIAQLATLILAAYVFKLAVAVADTIPFYIGTHYLRRFLHIDPTQR